MTKLPVWATIRAAYRALWDHRWWLLHRAAFPLVLFVAIQVNAFSIGVSATEQIVGPITGYWYALVFEVIALGPLILFFIPALRRLLQGRQCPPVAWPLPLSPSALKLLHFLWPYPYSPAVVRVIGLFALMVVVRAGLDLVWHKALPLGDMDNSLWLHVRGLLSLCDNLLVLYLLVRMSFLPIRLVLDQTADLRARWHETSVNGARLLVVMLIAQLPVYLLVNCLYLAASPVQHIVWSTLIGIDCLMTLVVWAAVTVTAFAHLTAYPAIGVALPLVDAREASAGG